MIPLTEISSAASAVFPDYDAAPIRRFKPRKFPLSDGLPVEVVEPGPSATARLAALTSRITVRPILSLGAHVMRLPYPWGLIDSACRILPQTPGAVRSTVRLPHATAQLVRAPGVLPGNGDRRVVLYLHGGAFLMCGANSHGKTATALSSLADAHVLVVNYRLLPKYSIAMAVDDCHDAYQWLRAGGYEPDQIVLAGDSAGGYLALALAQRLQQQGEQPAALVAMSPLLQLAKRPAKPRIKADAMFTAKAVDALVALAATAAAKHRGKGEPEPLYEPLDHIKPGLPRTLIHVSGSEVLLHDAQLAADRLAAAGVPVELRVWPGQIHDFQVVTPMVPEASRSLRQIGEFIRDATDSYAVSRATKSPSAQRFSRLV